MNYGLEGLLYDSPLKGRIVINRGTKLLELLSKIYTILGLERSQYKLRLTYRYPVTLGIGPNMNIYVGLEIGNDKLIGDLVIVVVDNPNMVSVAFYVEAEDINAVIGCSQTKGVPNHY